MDKVIMPFLFVAVAAGLFFSYIRPTYDVLLALQEQEARLDETLERSKALDQRVVDLTQKFNSMSEADTDKLDALLPETVDTVRMVVLLDTLAKRSDVDIETFDIPVVGPADGTQALTWADFSLDCTGAYGSLKQFLVSMERSLTLMEVTSLSVQGANDTSATEGQVIEENTPTYSIRFQTPYVASVASLK